MIQAEKSIEERDQGLILNQKLQEFNSLLEDIKNPKDAELSLHIIKDMLVKLGDIRLAESQKDKKVIMDNINALIGNAGKMLEMMDANLDKGQITIQILENSKALIKKISQNGDPLSEKNQKAQLNNALVELASKAIEEEGRVEVDGRSKLIMPENIAQSLEDGKQLKEKLEKALTRLYWILVALRSILIKKT